MKQIDIGHSSLPFNNIYIREDFQSQNQKEVPKIKTLNIYERLMLNASKYSFIADWSLPEPDLLLGTSQ